jgi:hypothetical protein
MAIRAALIEVTATRRVCSSFGRFLSERSAGGSNAQYAIGSVSNLLSRNSYELDIVCLARVHSTIAVGEITCAASLILAEQLDLGEMAEPGQCNLILTQQLDLGEWPDPANAA